MVVSGIPVMFYFLNWMVPETYVIYFSAYMLYFTLLKKGW